LELLTLTCIAMEFACRHKHATPISLEALDVHANLTEAAKTHWMFVTDLLTFAKSHNAHQEIQDVSVLMVLDAQPTMIALTTFAFKSNALWDLKDVHAKNHKEPKLAQTQHSLAWQLTQLEPTLDVLLNQLNAVITPNDASCFVELKTLLPVHHVPIKRSSAEEMQTLAHRQLFRWSFYLSSWLPSYSFRIKSK